MCEEFVHGPPSAAACRDATLRLYGQELHACEGVLHVASVWRTEEGAYHLLAIHPGTPRSAADRFALGLARARVDAIVTTGRILRAEPGLHHWLADPADRVLAESLEDWRRERVGHREPPRSVVLTRGRDLDLRHPLFGHARSSGAPKPLLVTDEDGAARLRDAAHTAGVEVLCLQRCGLRECLEALRRRGVRGISVEAGAATAAALYAEPVAVDELMLSIFEGAELGPEVRGPVLFVPGQPGTALSPAPFEQCVEEPSGPWRFRRYLRGPGAPARV